MTGDSWKLPGELLVDLGMLALLPANNAPHYQYGPIPDGDPPTRCSHWVEVPIRETGIWCPVCKLEGAPEPSYLHRKFVAPAMFQVWHEHFNHTTGHMESDRKRMEQRLAAISDKRSEELGIAHSYVRGDPGEYRKERIRQGADKKGRELEAGAVNTHNVAVAEGRKESKGRFVWD